MSAEGLAEATRRMRDHGEHERSISAFEDHYRSLEQILSTGAGGTIPEASIDPLTELPSLEAYDPAPGAMADALRRVATVKLNGGLGTSMGISGPKTALAVKEGLTFLDIIARQTLALRRRHGVDLPLLLMNSFRTRDESLAILARYPDLPVGGLPLDFLQSAEPKLRSEDLAPVDWPQEPQLEWCPPGHGDVYPALASSGLLGTLLDKGFRYVFLSNADNLGATCDPRIAAWLAEHDVPYLAEVCDRTINDRKGGHLAVRKSDGRLVLRDSAMVAAGEESFFQDNARHTTFHANNLWVDLHAVQGLLDGAQARGEGSIGLPVIVNRKTVDPSDPSSTAVIQIETAMGAAIERIEGARALHVPRDRFRPVKTTNELLLVRSDIFDLDEDSHIVSLIDHPEPLVDLDGVFYKLVPDFEERFPVGVPSMRAASSLRVRGDVTFGADVVCTGDVVVDVSDGDGSRTAHTWATHGNASDVRSFEEHRAAVLAAVSPGHPVRLPLVDCLGLVLCEDVSSQVDLPPFDNSAMDGYAVRAADVRAATASDESTAVTLPVVGEVAAGGVADRELGPGEAIRIMTGAMMPPGADAIVKVEDTDGGTARVLVRTGVPSGTSVRPAGQDVRADQVVLTAGAVIDARRMALLAATGHGEALVRPRPRVAVVSTGAELVPAGQPLLAGQIHDSNSPMLEALVRECGANPTHRLSIDDDGDAVLALVTRLADEVDAIVTSGGVSMGAYDVVKESLRDHGVDFVQVAMQPGKPQGFGRVGTRGVPVFALPGNPVSSYVSFEMFVRPALRRMMGLEPVFRPVLRARLLGPLLPPGRTQVARAVATRGDGGWLADPVWGQASHFVADLARASCFVIVPAETTRVEAGDELEMWLLDDGPGRGTP